MSNSFQNINLIHKFLLLFSSKSILQHQYYFQSYVKIKTLYIQNEINKLKNFSFLLPIQLRGPSPNGKYT